MDNDIVDIINQNTNNKVSNLIEFKSHQIIDSKDTEKVVMVEVIFNNIEYQLQHQGNGVIDAIFKAINEITKVEPILNSFTIDAISSGSDAKGMSNVVLFYNGKSFAASGIDHDITIAAAKAYISGINKILNSF